MGRSSSSAARSADGVVVRMPSGAASSSSSSAPSAPRRSSTVERLKAPDWLSPSGRSAFRHVVRHFEADAPGWLTGVDVDLLALAVEHLAVAKAASKAMRGPGGRYAVTTTDEAHRDRLRKTPAHQVFREATASYVALARELGLTPKARVELEVGLGGLGPDGDEEDGEDLLDG
jgi:P27 family predicted phage terminase small subunit